MKILKKTTAIALALILLAGILPMPAVAEHNNAEYEDEPSLLHEKAMDYEEILDDETLEYEISREEAPENDEPVDAEPDKEGFTVAFNANGGINSPGQALRITGADGAVGPENMPNPPPTLTDFAFRHWNYEQDGSGWIFNGWSQVTEDVTVYAQWGHSVSFDGNGITLSPGGGWQDSAHSYVPRIIPRGESANSTAGVVWPNNPTRAGWLFDGWYTVRDLEGGTRFDGDSIIEHNVALFARWVPNTVALITFDPQGGVLAGGHSDTRRATIGTMMSSNRALNEGVLNPTGAPLVIKQGLALEGWWTAPGGPDGGGTRFGAPGDGSWPARRASSSISTTIRGDITVYAHWIKRIAFNPNGAASTPISWGAGTSGLIATVDFPAETENGTIYADGTWTNNSSSGVAGRFVFPEEPARAGFVFAGWFDTSAATGGNQLFGDTNIDEFFANQPSGQMSVWARWEQEPPATIIFDTSGGQWQGGSAERHISIIRGQTFRQSPNSNLWPEPPTREGYIFLGWWPTPDHEVVPLPPDPNNMWSTYEFPGQFTANTVITDDMTVYAVWTNDFITLNFHPGRAGVTDPAQIRRLPTGWSFSAMSTLVNGFYAHSGGSFSVGFGSHGNTMDGGGGVFNISFDSQPDGLGEPFPFSKHFYEDADYYGVWGATLAFNNNHRAIIPTVHNSTMRRTVLAGLTHANNHTHKHAFGWQPYIWPNTHNWRELPLTGFGVMGWNTQHDGSGEWVTSDTVINGNTQVFAIWVEGVAFQSGFAPDTVIAPENRVRFPVFPGTVNDTPQGMPPNPEWPGQVFHSWNTNPNRTGTTFAGSSVIPMGTTLYATWDTIVTFDPNAPDAAMPGATTASIISGNTIGQAFPPNPVRPGWSFIGWNTAPDGSGIAAMSNAPTVIESMTLYAMWHRAGAGTVPVSFIPGSGGSLIGETTVEVSAGATLQAQNIPTPVPGGGYSFAGWYFDDNPISANEMLEMTIAEPIIFEARFEAILSPSSAFRIYYNLNGGVGGPTPNPETDKPAGVHALSTVEPTHANVSDRAVKFLGWSLTRSPAILNPGAPIPALVTAVTITDSNLTVYAVWMLEANAAPSPTFRVYYNIYYNLNGGAGGPTPNPETDKPAGAHALSTLEPTHANVSGRAVKFLGWSLTRSPAILNPGAPIPALVTAVTITDSDVTVYAVWMLETAAETHGPPPSLASYKRQAYIIGCDLGLIQPLKNMTRAEAATIFFRLIKDEARADYWAQSSNYSDIQLTDWFNNAVCTMTNKGVFNGYHDNTFAPNKPITRAEMAAAIVRFMNADDAPQPVTDLFNDIENHWAKTYINAAGQHGWIVGPEGIGGPFQPERPITRAEAAAFINRIYGRMQESADDLLPDMLIWPDNLDSTAWYYLYLQSASNSYTYDWKCSIYERWLTIIPARNWAALERPYSLPNSVG